MEVLDVLEENQQPNYAGFWIRFVAIFIDGIVLSLVFVPTFMLFYMPENGFLELAQNPNDFDALITYYSSLAGFSIMEFIISLLYFSIMQSAMYQATLGKMAVGIIVVDENGNKMKFGRAVGRNLAKIVSGIILNIGYLIAAFDSRKQALHDKIAGTFVIYKN